MVYHATSAVSGAPPDAADIGWRIDFFHDPLLQELIAIALRNNRDLRKAGAQCWKPPGVIPYSSARRMLPTLGIATAMDAGRTPADLSVTDGKRKVNRRYEMAGAAAARLDLWGECGLSDRALAAYMALDETYGRRREWLVSGSRQRFG